jgi:predicted kinase
VSIRPDGIEWLTAGRTAAELRYPANALLLVGGPSGAGKSTLAARAVAPGVPVLDPDATRAALEADWPRALAAFRAELGAAVAEPGPVVVVTTALRRGHRLGLARQAAAHGRPLHLLMLDADLALCRAGRAAQPAQRIHDGLFEHLVREWAALRRSLSAGAVPERAASVTVLDRPAVDALRRIAFSG